jgi:hypothetical protein
VLVLFRGSIGENTTRQFDFGNSGADHIQQS